MAWGLKLVRADGANSGDPNRSFFPGKNGPSRRPNEPASNHLYSAFMLWGLKTGIYTMLGRNALSQAYDLHSPYLPEGKKRAEREVGNLWSQLEQDIKLFLVLDWVLTTLSVDCLWHRRLRARTEMSAVKDYQPMEPLIYQGQLLISTDVQGCQKPLQDLQEAL